VTAASSLAGLKALSVRQPWAWAIIHAGKDVENRSVGAVRHMVLHPGHRLAIHAARGMMREEFEDAADFMRWIGVTCPPAAELTRGAIIGSVGIVGVVSKSDSLWFFGPRGILVCDPRPREPIAAVGAPGLFSWSPAGEVAAPAKWMLPKRESAGPPEPAMERLL
jgi:hypothetical protein